MHPRNYGILQQCNCAVLFTRHIHMYSSLHIGKRPQVVVHQPHPLCEEWKYNFFGIVRRLMVIGMGAVKEKYDWDIVFGKVVVVAAVIKSVRVAGAIIQVIEFEICICLCIVRINLVQFGT